MPGFPEPPDRAGDDVPVVLPIEETLDLHPFAAADVASVVGEYLREAHRRGLREVRIIHGRGQGVQRAIVHRILKGHPLVAAFAEAPPSAGGWGATVVALKGDGREGAEDG